MNPTPVIESEVERNRRMMTLYRLAVGIGPSGMTTELHPYCQITALNEGRIRMGEIRITLADGLQEVRLLCHRCIINLRPERLINGVWIGREPVRRDLWTIEHPPPHVAEERLGILGCAFAQEVAQYDFRDRVDGEPEIAVAIIVWIVVPFPVLSRMDKGIRLVNLDEGDLEITDALVMQAITALADPETEPHDGIPMHTSESRDRSDGHAFGEKGDDLDLLMEWELVHGGPLYMATPHC